MPVLPPNLETYITRGFNPLHASFMGKPIFDLTYAQQKSTTYGPPSDSKSTYDIPDNITFQEYPELNSYQLQTLMETEEDFKNAYSFKVGASASGVTWSGSLSSSLTYQGELFQSESESYYLDFRVQTVYKVQRNAVSSLNGDFSEALAALPADLSSDANKDAYFRFFDSYGTHYLEFGMFGGYSTMETSISDTLLQQYSEQEITASIQAGYDGLVSSGSLNVDTAYSSSEFLKQHRSEMEVRIGVTGGIYNESLTDYCTSCFDDPVLLLGPAGGSELQPVLQPLSKIAGSRQAVMDEAIGLYWSPAAPSALGKLASQSAGNVMKATSDGFLLGYMNCVNNGGRGYLHGLTDSTDNPSVLRAAASAHNYHKDDRWVSRASFLMPVRKGDHFVETYTETSGGDPTVATALATLGAGLDKQCLGTWTKLPLNLPNMMTSDGFVVCAISCTNNGDRGQALLTDGAFTLAATSAHWYTQHDTWYPSQSFCVPVARNRSFTLQWLPSSVNPTVDAYWIPLQQFSLDQSIATRTANQTYQAESDGFLVCVLTAANGGRGYVEIRANAKQDMLSASPALAGTSVHLWTKSDTWLPANTVTVPIRSGSYYRADWTLTSDGAAPSIYWVALKS